MQFQLKLLGARRRGRVGSQIVMRMPGGEAVGCTVVESHVTAEALFVTLETGDDRLTDLLTGPPAAWLG